MKVTVNDTSTVLTVLTELQNFPATAEYAQAFHESYVLYVQALKGAQAAIFDGLTAQGYIESLVKKAEETATEKLSDEKKEEITKEVIAKELEFATISYTYNPQAPMGLQFLLLDSPLINFLWGNETEHEGEIIDQAEATLADATVLTQEQIDFIQSKVQEGGLTQEEANMLLPDGVSPVPESALTATPEEYTAAIDAATQSGSENETSETSVRKESDTTGTGAVE
jgi:hypothetical protein